MKLCICVLIAIVLGCSDVDTDNRTSEPDALPAPGDTKFYSLEPPPFPCSGNVNNVNNLDDPGECASISKAVSTGLPGVTVAYANGLGMRITNLSNGDSSVTAYDGCLTYVGATESSYIALVDGYRGIVDGRYVHQEPAVVIASASATQPEAQIKVLDAENIAGGMIDGDLLKVAAWDGASTVLFEFPLDEQGIGEPSVVTLSDEPLRSAWVVDERLVVRSGEKSAEPPVACVVSSGPNSTCTGMYPTTERRYSNKVGNDVIDLRDERVLNFDPGYDQMSLFVEGETTASSTVTLDPLPEPGVPPVLLDDFAAVLLNDGTWVLFEISPENALVNPQEGPGSPSSIVPLDGNRLLALAETAVLYEATPTGLTELDSVELGFEDLVAETLSIEAGVATVEVLNRRQGGDVFLRADADQLTAIVSGRVDQNWRAVERDGAILALSESAVQTFHFDDSPSLELDYDRAYALVRNEDVAVKAVLTRAATGDYESYLEVFDPQNVDTVFAKIPLDELDPGFPGPTFPPATLVLKGERLAMIGRREIETDSQRLEVWNLESPSNPTRIAAVSIEDAPLVDEAPIFLHGNFVIQGPTAIGLDGQIRRLSFEQAEAILEYQSDGRFFFRTRRSTESGLVHELIELGTDLEMSEPINVPGRLLHLDGNTGTAFSNLVPGSAINVFELSDDVATLRSAGLIDAELYPSRVASDGERVVGSGDDLYEFEIESMTATRIAEATTQALQVDGGRLITTSQSDACASGLLRKLGYLQTEDGDAVHYHNADQVILYSERPPELAWGTPMLAVDAWGRVLQW